MGDEGHRRLDGRARDPAQRGHRRHDPGLAHARSPARRPRARGRGRPAGPPVDGSALVPAPGQRLPRLRPDDVDVLPGDGPATSRPTSRTGCRSGARPTRASRTSASRSWAASSTARARASTPTSGSACRARSRSRSRRCSSTASSTGPCAATRIVAEFLGHPRRLRRAPLPAVGDELTGAPDRRRPPPRSGHARPD